MNLLVAISGGADSVVLLHRLVTEQKHFCVAAHCNFSLRGAESDRDEAFVRKFCDEMGVALHVQRFNTRQYAEERHISIEMAARELRYTWFARLKEQLNLDSIAVAHHADDEAETFMLNLVRGTGIRGLTGMQNNEGGVIRPMLDMSRNDVERYCRAHKLSYVTDSTNLQDVYMRNRIRHNVIPVFKGINPQFLRTMQANMANLRQVYAVFKDSVDAFVDKNVVELDGQTLVPIESLQKLGNAEPYLFEILYPMGFTPDEVHKMSACIANKHWGRIWFAPRHKAVLDRYNLIVLEMPEGDDERQEVVNIELGQTELFRPIHLTIAMRDVDENFAISKDPYVAHLAADKLSFPLTLRHWIAGDTFRPLGMRRFKKLQDFFVDEKYSRVAKDNAWVLTQGDEICWIVGKRLDDRYKILPTTRQVVEIRLHKS